MHHFALNYPQKRYLCIFICIKAGILSLEEYDTAGERGMSLGAMCVKKSQLQLIRAGAMQNRRDNCRHKFKPNILLIMREV